MRSLGRAALDWFWRGNALAAAKQELPLPSDRATILASRARVAAVIARGALQPSEALRTPAFSVASELYRQAIYWALASLAATSDGACATDDAKPVWDTLNGELLSRVSSDPERIELLQGALRSGSFLFFSDLPPNECQVLAVDLRALADAVLTVLDRRERTLRTIFWQRMWRLALLVLLALCASSGVHWLRQARETRQDLAISKEWRTSSRLGRLGCTALVQQCSASSGFFFHTAEEQNPWVEIDLGALATFSHVLIDNRSDCCEDRAVPLVVEVSKNQHEWHSVARRDSEFSTWRASFAPVEARWVRLRVLRKTYFHLARVRILP